MTWGWIAYTDIPVFATANHNWQGKRPEVRELLGRKKGVHSCQYIGFSHEAVRIKPSRVAWIENAWPH